MEKTVKTRSLERKPAQNEKRAYMELFNIAEKAIRKWILKIIEINLNFGQSVSNEFIFNDKLKLTTNPMMIGGDKVVYVFYLGLVDNWYEIDLPFEENSLTEGIFSVMEQAIWVVYYKTIQSMEDPYKKYFSNVRLTTDDKCKKFLGKKIHELEMKLEILKNDSAGIQELNNEKISKQDLIKEYETLLKSEKVLEEMETLKREFSSSTAIGIKLFKFPVKDSKKLTREEQQKIYDKINSE